MTTETYKTIKNMLDAGAGVKSLLLFWKVGVPPQQAPVETQIEVGSTTSAPLI